MSDRDQELIDRFRRSYDAFSRGDFNKAMENAHPEIEFFPPGGQAPIKGAAALRAWMEPDALEDQRVEALEIRPSGNKVLAHQKMSARGAGSGIELDVESWVVWTLDDEGLTTRLEVFPIHQKAEALEAAGLSE
jgi:ketosteroid isomerase-like protein